MQVRHGTVTLIQLVRIACKTGRVRALSIYCLTECSAGNSLFIFPSKNVHRTQFTGTHRDSPYITVQSERLVTDNSDGAGRMLELCSELTLEPVLQDRLSSNIRFVSR